MAGQSQNACTRPKDVAAVTAAMTTWMPAVCLPGSGTGITIWRGRPKDSALATAIEAIQTWLGSASLSIRVRHVNTWPSIVLIPSTQHVDRCSLICFGRCLSVPHAHGCQVSSFKAVLLLPSLISTTMYVLCSTILFVRAWWTGSALQAEMIRSLPNA